MEGVINQAFRLLRAVRKAKELPKENQKRLGEYVSNIILETYNKNKERI